MSQKITSKNLSYSQNLPPFLARMQAQTSGSASFNDGPDPILSNQRRSGKKRSASEEAEDGPLVVDEQGHAVADVEVGKDGTVTEKESAGDDEDSKAEGKEDENQEKKSEAKSVVAARRKKVGKVIGGDDEEEMPATKDETSIRATQDGKASHAKDSKPRKKAKKIKLSFDEEE